jgi:hypothetical protein
MLTFFLLFAQIVPFPGPGRAPTTVPFDPTTSYANAGGTGDRSKYIAVNLSSGVAGSSVTASPHQFVNGNSADGGWLSFTASGEWFQFDFGYEHAIDEVKWIQSTTASHGTWKWQASNDASSWTDIGSSFTLGGATTQTQTAMAGNVTSYRYYRLLGISGSYNGSPDLHEVQFKISEPDGITTSTVWETGG